MNCLIFENPEGHHRLIGATRKGRSVTSRTAPVTALALCDGGANGWHSDQRQARRLPNSTTSAHQHDTASLSLIALPNGMHPARLWPPSAPTTARDPASESDHDLALRLRVSAIWPSGGDLINERWIGESAFSSKFFLRHRE